MDIEKLGKILERYAGWLSGLVALLTVALVIREKWLDLFGDPRNWSWREAVFAVGAVALVGGAIAWSRRAHASRLTDPDAFRLDPRSRDQFVGRTDDLRKLSKALANPLVFLVGESGCGKSALLQAGIQQSQEFGDRFLPVYIDMSFLDWEDGPLRAVREGFARGLPPDDSARGLLNARAEPEAFREAFSNYYQRTVRRPLLLLDQFDDYQAQPRHRERFLPRDTGVWRSADEIARDNEFWRMLRFCLGQDVISVVVACREDAAAGLESVRLLPHPAHFDLRRLERGYVRQLIDRLTERPAGQPQVIADPDNGWTSLRDRLVDDLEARGSVLPQQLKVAVGGLRTLRRLTVAAYALANRLPGLEATFVGGAVERASRTSGLGESDALRLLVGLVDLARQPPDKTPPRTTIELARSAIVAEPAASEALASLNDDEIVRPRGVRGETGSAWQLDHAYLAQPILRLQRDRDRWRLLLADRARVYVEARGSLRHRWSALLTLGEQTRLAAARLRGRFRYREYWSFALKSLVRGVPPLVVCGCFAVVVWGAIHYNKAIRVEGELAAVRTPLTDASAAGLLELARGNWAVRRQVESDVFTRPELARGFNNAPGPMLRALAGLDPARLEGLGHRQTRAERWNEPDPVLRDAAFNLAALAFPGQLKEGDPQAAEELGKLRDAIGKSTDPDQFSALAQAYAAVSARLKEGDPHAAEELGRLRGAIGPTTNAARLAALAQAYAAVSAKLKGGDPQAAEELGRLRDAIGHTTDAAQLAALAQAYAAVSAKLKDGDPQAAEELGRLRGAIGHTTDAAQLGALAQAYAAVSINLKGDPQAAEELSMLHNTIGRISIEGEASYDPDQLAALAQAYAAIGAKLKDDHRHAVGVLLKLQGAIEDTSVETTALMQAYVAVMVNVKRDDPPADEFDYGFDLLMEANDSDRLPVLAQAYAVAGRRPIEGDDSALMALGKLRDAIGNATNPDQLSALAQAYAAVSAKLKDGGPQAAEELGKLRGAIGKSTNPDQLSALTQAYAAVSAKLKDGDPQAAEELGKLRDAIGPTTNAAQLAALAQAYAAVSERAHVPRQDVATLMGRLRDLRSEDQFLAFAKAIMAATSSATPPFGWEQTGLIVTDLLLQPLSAGAPTRFLVTDYEKVVRRTQGAPQPAQPWSGDVWAFVAWAQTNLPLFNPDRSTVDFLPPVQAK
ncbi:MAG TPA: ATP-binding protein [Acetobacteraceae bacterium]